MKAKPSRPAGFSLMEAVIAIATLAVAIPLVFASMNKAGDISRAARAETQAPLIVNFIRTELDAARGGRSQVFGTLLPGQPLAGNGAKMLAFSEDSTLIGEVSGADYERGAARAAGRNAHYIVAVSTTPEREDTTSLLVTIRLEYPASRPARQRRSLEFHTLLP